MRAEREKDRLHKLKQAAGVVSCGASRLARLDVKSRLRTGEREKQGSGPLPSLDLMMLAALTRESGRQPKLGFQPRQLFGELELERVSTAAGV